jgi:hypothetical protein
MKGRPGDKNVSFLDLHSDLHHDLPSDPRGIATVAKYRCSFLISLIIGGGFSQLFVRIISSGLRWLKIG